MKKGYIVVFLTILLVFLNADQMVMSPNIGEIEKEFGVDDAQIGVVASVFSILGAAISLIWGFLTDKFNRKKLLIFSILIGEIPCMMSAFAGSFSELFFWRAMTGIGVGASFPIAYSIVGDMFNHEKRGKVSAILGVAVSLGAIVGMVIGGFVGGATGWRTPFLIVSIPNIVLGFAAFFILKEPKRGAMEVGIGELVQEGYSYPGKIKWTDYFNLFKVKTNLVLFFQGVVGTIPWGAIPYFLVEFLKRERGMDANIATLVFIVFGLGNIIGAVAGGFIGEWLYKKNPNNVPMLCGITTALGAVITIMVFVVVPDKSMGGVVLLSTIGFFAALFDSVTGPNMKMMLLNVNKPQDRGRIFSVFNLTDSLGAGFGKFVGGVLSISLGSLGAAMQVSSYFWFICAFFLFILMAFFKRDISSLQTQMYEMKKAVESSNA